MTSRQQEGEARWCGRVALVTGASSGIGAAIARQLAAESGMRVAAVARRLDRLEQLAQEVGQTVDPKLDAGEVWPIALDLRDTDAIRHCFEQIDERWDGVDVLVNNAGLGRDAPLTSGSTAAWREMLEVNVLGLSVCTREAVQRMRRRGIDDGHIIHISSMSSHRVPPGSGMYAATKFAVRALTEALRKELREQGSSIRVGAISPGYVETEFAERYHGSREMADETYSRFPVLQPEDIADAVCYMIDTPPHVQIHDMLMRPTEQPR